MTKVWHETTPSLQLLYSFSVLQTEVANLKSRINSNAAKLTSYQSALKEAQHLKTEVFQLKNKLGESLGQLNAIQSKNGEEIIPRIKKLFVCTLNFL